MPRNIGKTESQVCDMIMTATLMPQESMIIYMCHSHDMIAYVRKMIEYLCGKWEIPIKRLAYDCVHIENTKVYVVSSKDRAKLLSRGIKHVETRYDHSYYELGEI